MIGFSKNYVHKGIDPRFIGTLLLLVGLISFGAVLNLNLLDVPELFALFWGIVALFIAVGRVREFLLFLTVYIPFEGFLLKWLPAEVGSLMRFFPEVTLYLAVSRLLLASSGKRHKWVNSGLELPFALLVLFSVFSCLLNDMSILNGILELRLILRYIAIVFLLVNLGVDARFVHRFILLLFVAGLVQALIGLSQAMFKYPVYEFFSPGTFHIFGTSSEATLQPFTSTLIRGTLTRYTNFGDFLCIVILLLVSIRTELRSAYSKLALWAFPLLGLTLLLSTCRHAGGALVVGLGTIALLKGKWRSFLWIPFVLIFAWGANNAVRSWAGTAPLDRYFEVLSPEFRLSYRTYSTGSRWIAFWYVPQTVFSKAQLAIFGVGTGSFRFAGVREDILDRKLGVGSFVKVHDVYWVRLLVTFGVVGLGIWIFLLYRSATASLRLLKASQDSLSKAVAFAHLAVLVGVSEMAFFGDYFETRETSFYLWMLAGITAVLCARTGERT